ncbi:MAG: TlpA family protein disulfide reductase [Gammaproteobacteria bacterium]|nr:TlpA family protein disulfide reductase [Gammaproteobacteria bacterium]
MNSNKQKISLTIIILITITLLWLIFDNANKANSPEVVKKSHSLKSIDFSLPDLKGERQNFSQWQGKVVLLNFWATWCPPCRREIPDFIDVYEQYKKKDFVIIGIGTDNEEKVARFVKNLNISYPILVGGRSAMSVSYQYGNNSGALPYSILIDKHGIIRYRAGGLISKQKLISLIEPLL